MKLVDISSGQELEGTQAWWLFFLNLQVKVSWLKYVEWQLKGSMKKKQLEN